jgi:hypothetical protein
MSPGAGFAAPDATTTQMRGHLSATSLASSKPSTGNIRSANEKFCRALGYRLDDVGLCLKSAMTWSAKTLGGMKRSLVFVQG